MQRFTIEQSDADIVSHAGLALIGQCIHRHTNLSQELNTQVPLRHGIAHADVLKSYLALACLGKSDFEAINTIESPGFFRTAMDIGSTPSAATLRQRMDGWAETFRPIIENASRDFLINTQPSLSCLDTGHIPIDADVTPMPESVTSGRPEAA
jgi:hypothetical protein